MDAKATGAVCRWALPFQTTVSGAMQLHLSVQTNGIENHVLQCAFGGALPS